jgi:hypothetical protein
MDIQWLEKGNICSTQMQQYLSRERRVRLLLQWALTEPETKPSLMTLLLPADQPIS